MKSDTIYCEDGTRKFLTGGQSIVRHNLYLAFVRAKAEGYTDDEAADLLLDTVMKSKENL